ncbi:MULTISPECIES: TetR/AcrR family transcriptional regulator [unclassified Paludibacterium]|uniref:TetR/AcrR family transcriptional regulator n=1 Tax=unclassified Paludibacterium TaxID=2618429 RepID=UPI001C048D60|nr:TetR/AcrR family transcriptional regulator [Paludibacterium sp. B53371]BEV71733.1 TetR family multidrug efflux transcriptional regulator VceR [Paludibacterium sp. THUN1379]
MRAKSEIRRQAILDVAEEVFREKGFELASMSEITARVGGSKATLYNYFASKEDLFLEVMHRFAETAIHPLFEGLDAQQPLRQTLQTFGESFIGFISQQRLITLIRVLYAESGRTDVGRRFYLQGPHDGEIKLAQYLQSCMERGALRQTDPRVASCHMMALLRAEILDPLLFGASELAQLPPIPQTVERAVETFLLAYRP